MRMKDWKRLFALVITAAMLVSLFPITGTGAGVAPAYEETFASGLGAAVQSGGAALKQVAGKPFDGNEDGAALHVGNRTNTWDAADFLFDSLGLADGKGYEVEVTGYVDADVPIEPGAQMVLGTNLTFSWLNQADIVAGQAFRLTAVLTVNKQENSAFRIQTNEAAQAVPFYVGNVRVTEKPEADAGAQAAVERPAAEPFTPITFEDGTENGFAGRAGTEVLAVVDEANHTEGGSKALKVTGRTIAWHGPAVRVERHIDLGSEYTISVWVKQAEPASAELQLSTQIGDGSGASYLNLAKKALHVDDGWAELTGTYRYTSVGNEFVTIYVESGNETASFYVDDITLSVKSASAPGIEKGIPSLHETYKDDFPVGTAISQKDIAGIRRDLLRKHFNATTAENAMKPGELQPTKGTFRFIAADALVNTSLEYGMQVHGHVLVWHQQTPDWMTTAADGVLLSREEALDNMKTHIRTVMTHFGDRVISWDVVNEAISDGPSDPDNWKTALRDSPWRQAIGDDFVEQAFLAAREVLDENPSWDVKLYYNDYNLDNQNKAKATHAMVKALNDTYAAANPGKRLIDGVGMQGHYSTSTNPANVALSLERFISLGVEVSITELDVMAGGNQEQSDAQAQAQAYLYARLFKLFREHAEHIARVTLWGMDDGNSWRSESSPLLFNRDLQSKPAYEAVIDPDAYLAAHTPETVDALRAVALYGTPELDGSVDALWETVEAMDVSRHQMAWQGATGTAKALWDDKNLYVLFQVNDAQLDKASTNPWEQDSVEVFVDENNTKTSFYEEDDGQYRVNFGNEATFNPETIAEGFASAVSVSGTSYVVEMRIPFRTLAPADGTEIGFDAQINDGKDGARQSVATWNALAGTGYQDTSVFGVLTLRTADAAVEPARSEPGPSVQSQTEQASSVSIFSSPLFWGVCLLVVAGIAVAGFLLVKRGRKDADQSRK